MVDVDSGANNNLSKQSVYNIIHTQTQTHTLFPSYNEFYNHVWGETHSLAKFYVQSIST